MRVDRRGLALLPPMLAGLAAAIALETSTGLLLYADEGLLPALTLILTVEMGSLGLGLWSGLLPVGGGAVEQVRRRWLFSLVVFAGAAVLSTGFHFMGDIQVGGLGQGVGLGFLGGLPLFSVGSLLGAMSRPDDLGRPSRPLVGAPAVFGAAVGFLLSGSILLPNAAAYTLYLFCLVMLSGGALLQGWVLDIRPLVEVLEVVAGPTGELRLEERALGSPRRDLKVLFEDGRLRGVEGPEGDPGRGWEIAVLEGLKGEERRPGSLLYLGGGSGTLVRVVSRRFPEARIQVVERSRELVDMARAHFGPWEGWDGVGLQIGEPLDSLPESQNPFSMILLDCGVLPTLGGVPLLSEGNWRSLVDRLQPGGVLVMGGLPSNRGDSHLLLGEMMGAGRKWVGGVCLYRTDPVPPTARLLQRAGDGAETLLLFSTPGAAAWPLALSDFQLYPVEES